MGRRRNSLKVAILKAMLMLEVNLKDSNLTFMIKLLRGKNSLHKIHPPTVSYGEPFFGKSGIYGKFNKNGSSMEEI